MTKEMKYRAYTLHNYKELPQIKYLSPQDIEAIDAATAELNTVFQAASQDMYNAQDAGAQQGAGGPQDAGQQGPSQGGGSDDDVTDVDFEEVK